MVYLPSEILSPMETLSPHRHNCDSINTKGFTDLSQTLRPRERDPSEQIQLRYSPPARRMILFDNLAVMGDQVKPFCDMLLAYLLSFVYITRGGYSTGFANPLDNHPCGCLQALDDRTLAN